VDAHCDYQINPHMTGLIVHGQSPDRALPPVPIETTVRRSQPSRRWPRTMRSRSGPALGTDPSGGDGTVHEEPVAVSARRWGPVCTGAPWEDYWALPGFVWVSLLLRSSASSVFVVFSPCKGGAWACGTVGERPELSIGLLFQVLPHYKPSTAYHYELCWASISCPRREGYPLPSCWHKLSYINASVVMLESHW